MQSFASAALYFIRFRHEDPPLAPYGLIALVSAAGNWLGENGGSWAAVALLISGAFFLLHLASLPYPEDAE